ncbi:MAG: insulinase family protein [Bdellovibrionaceae bacterium]|nr:insulinase family protein [Pseudobdellovibrionaceae bacterium]
MKLKKFQLKNDLEVITVENHKSPVVSVQMWVHTGSADEGKGEEGISHFIEHLVFKGTTKYKVGEIASLVEGSGGELNAYTSFDQTVFYVTISKEYIDTAMDVISQMMGHPLFDETEINNEREVVLEEIKRTEDNPHRQAGSKLFEGAFKKHPYGIPVIGYAKNIKTVKKEVLTNYFHRRYTPENMTLLVVGDFDGKTIKAKINSYFSDAPKFKTKKVKRKAEEPQSRARYQFVEGPFQETLMHLAWKIPKVTHKDIPALDVLSMILGQGDSSRLMKSLRIENPLTNYCVASTFTPKDPGFFAISSSLLVEKSQEAFEVLCQQLERVLSVPPSLKELDKIKINIESDELYALETVDGLARKFGTYHDLFEDPEYYKEWIEKIQNLLPKDILRVARKYLNPSQMNAVILSKGKVKSLEENFKTFQKNYKKVYDRTLPEKPQKETIEKRPKIKWQAKNTSKTSGVKKLSSGANLIYFISPDSPVVSMKVAWLGGLRAQEKWNSGLTEVLSRTWVSDTEDYTEQQLHLEVDKLASHIGAFGGRNTFGLAMTSLVPLLDPAFEIFESVTHKALFKDEVIKREIDQIKEQIKNREDNPAQQCSRNFNEKMFSGHPYGSDPLGDMESLILLRSNDIKEYLTPLMNANNMDIVIVGDVNLDYWTDKLEAFSSKLPRGKKFNKQFAINPLQKSEEIFLESKKEQSHVILGFPGLTLTSPERYTLQVIQSILAGQGGRLFLELRDKESLAYSVSPMRLDGIDVGYFGAYIACSPEKVKKSINMLQAEFDKLLHQKVSEKEILRAKRYLIGRHDIELQKNSSISSSLIFDHIYGLPYNETFHFAQKLEKVSAQDIQEVARQIFSQKAVISVVGSQSPW